MANNNKNRVPFSFNKVKDMYHKSDVVMWEMLASIPADCMSIEDAFYLYIAAQNWANGDEFTQVLGDNDNEKIDLVKEAIKHLKQSNIWNT